LLNPAYALTAALIWAFSPIYYRGFLGKFDFVGFNLLRTASSSAVLFIPALHYWSYTGQGFAVPSGVITLACGDSLFLLSIRETGASVAAPVVYTYVLMVQLVGVALGQVVPYANFAAAVMVILGVYILSRGGEGKPRAKGIAFAISAGIFWTVGQELIQLATGAGGSIVAVTFTRNASAAAALGVAFLLTRKGRAWPSGLGAKQYGFILAVTISDLVLGSLLFVYSISTIGVALTVILTSVSPLLTQVFARALGKESPSPRDFVGGVLIVAALVVAVGL
jgi:DME family drug/metabolite transporter